MGRRKAQLDVEVEENEESENQTEEIKVKFIHKERYNTKNEEVEYLVEWDDDAMTWEPIENLKDEDGTENIELVRYDIRKEMQASGLQDSTTESTCFL
jgi:hypothetical protein